MYIYAAPLPWDELKHLVEIFSGRSWPKIGPGIILYGVFETFVKKNSKICAHSERYRNILAVIFGTPTLYANNAFPLSPVSQLSFFGFSNKLLSVCDSSKFGWVGKHKSIVMKPTKSPTQENWLKWHLGDAFPQQRCFRRLGFILYRK